MTVRSIARSLADTSRLLGRCALDCVHRRPEPAGMAGDRVFPELKKLRLAGSYYDQHELMGALERHLRLDLQLVEKDIALSQSMLRQGVRGCLVVVPEQRYGEIWVPQDLDSEELAGIMSHELAHLIANHPLPVRNVMDEPERVRFWLPRKRFQARRPPFDLKRCEYDPQMRNEMLQWCEQEADLWAEHLRTFSTYGPRALFRDTSLLSGKRLDDT